MIEQELKNLIDKVQNRKCEEQIVEIKAANKGYPEKIHELAVGVVVAFQV